MDRYIITSSLASGAVDCIQSHADSYLSIYRSLIYLSIFIYIYVCRYV